MDSITSATRSFPGSTPAAANVTKIRSLSVHLTPHNHFPFAIDSAQQLGMRRKSIRLRRFERSARSGTAPFESRRAAARIYFQDVRLDGLLDVPSCRPSVPPPVASAPFKMN